MWPLLNIGLPGFRKVSPSISFLNNLAIIESLSAEAFTKQACVCYPHKKPACNVGPWLALGNLNFRRGSPDCEGGSLCLNCWVQTPWCSEQLLSFWSLRRLSMCWAGGDYVTRPLRKTWPPSLRWDPGDKYFTQVVTVCVGKIKSSFATVRRLLVLYTWFRQDLIHVLFLCWLCFVAVCYNKSQL